MADRKSLRRYTGPSRISGDDSYSAADLCASPPTIALAARGESQFSHADVRDQSARDRRAFEG
jgi:hypothetical protein